MGLGVATPLHGEKISEQGVAAGAKNQGALKADGKEHAVTPIIDPSATEGVSEFLQNANQQDASGETADHTFIHITPTLVETEGEIARLLAELGGGQPQEKGTTETKTATQGTQPHAQGSSTRDAQGRERPVEGSAARSAPPVVHSSLFSLARSFNSTLFGKKEQAKNEGKQAEQAAAKQEGRAPVMATSVSPFERFTEQQNRFDREGNGRQRDGQEEEKEGSGQHQQEHKQSHSQKPSEKKKLIQGVSAARGGEPRSAVSNLRASQSEGSGGGGHTPRQVVGSVENIYVRFMALMARILRQSELEAHDLYLRIKERTDNIDVLTLLMSKINSEKGAIDWTNNAEMKALLEKARAMGVEIPKDKFKWTEEEKKLFKENIQMRKDSMEKVTQLERTDMQRYLQEASQCHQARSNVLKLLKEVIDNIIANMRS